MGTFTVDHAIARHAFLAQLDRFVEVVGALDDHELLAPSRCHGWSRLEVVVHVRTGLQEMFGGAVSTTRAVADTDAASYWSSYASSGAEASGDNVDGILWTRRTASAYRRPTESMEHLRMVAQALRSAVRHLEPGRVAFQECVLTTGDFLATWAVELAVHQLDLGDGVGAADGAALTLARETVNHLLEVSTPEGWDAEQVILLGAGRIRPSDADIAECPALGGVPVLG